MKTNIFLKFSLYLVLICLPQVVNSYNYDMYKLVLVTNSGGKLIKSVQINNDLSLLIRVYSGVTMIRIDYYQDGINKYTKTYAKNDYNDDVLVPIALTNRFMVSASYYAVNTDPDYNIIPGGNYHIMIYEIEFAH